MIVILTEQDCYYNVTPGCTFSLMVGDQTIIQEDIAISGFINYAATFIFTDEDGKCYCTNACGFFGEKKNLPKELKEAKRITDLTQQQFSNLINTSSLCIRTT